MQEELLYIGSVQVIVFSLDSFAIQVTQWQAVALYVSEPFADRLPLRGSDSGAIRANGDLCSIFKTKGLSESRLPRPEHLLLFLRIAESHNWLNWRTICHRSAD